MFKTHLALGILVSVLVINYLQLESWILFGITLVFASVLPDIDISKSKVGKKFWPLSSIISFLFGHRGFIHTIFPPIIAVSTATIFGYGTLGLAFLTGYGTHLISDIVTVQGLMPFFPLSKIKASGFIITGGLIEHTVFFGALIFLLRVVMTTF